MAEPLLNNMTVSTVQSYLRRERARGRLSEDEIRRLDALGFNWKKQKRTSYLYPGKNKPVPLDECLRPLWDSTKNSDANIEGLFLFETYWWKCPVCGFEWQRRLGRERAAKGCPACLGRTCIPRWTDLATTNPELADEWNYERNGELKPTDVVAGSAKSVWWKCSKCGGEWEAQLVKRKAGKGGCPFCSGRRLMKGVNDLASQYPQVALDYLPELNNGIPADEVIVKYGTKIRWRCHVCGYEWVSDVYDRTRDPKPSGCKRCSNKKRVQSERMKMLQNTVSFKDFNPPLASLWDYARNKGLRPEDLLPGTNGRYWFKCPKCGKSYLSYLGRKTLICDSCSRALPHSGRAVRCVETNKTYLSISAAAAAIGRHSSTISKALSKQQRTAGGYHWEYVDTTEEDIEEAN